MGADACGDYYVIVYATESLDGRSSTRWRWVIKRNSTDPGLVEKSGFLTEAGARLAGENALKNLLRGAFDDTDATG